MVKNMPNIPNIPSVQSSVIDTTVRARGIAQGRTPLIFHLSKYGDEEINEYSNIDYFLYKTGLINNKKYGLGSTFIRDSLTETSRVLAKRLVSDDATYSNLSINLSNETKSYDDIKNVSNLFTLKPFDTPTPIDISSADYIKWQEEEKKYQAKVIEKNNLLLGHIAKGRGSGYNDIYIMYSEATDYERMDSNIEGEAKYRFNYIKAEIFESVNDEFKQLGDPFVFSLMDRDIVTDNLIKNTLTGEELFINQTSTKHNDFVDIKINEKHLPQIREIRNIDDLMPNGRLIVSDINNNGTKDKYYEVKVITDKTTINNDLKIVPVSTNKLPTIPARLCYVSDIFPFVDPTRTDLNASIINSTDYDFHHPDTKVNWKDTPVNIINDNSVGVYVSKASNGDTIINAQLAMSSTSDIEVPMDARCIKSNGWADDSSVAFGSTFTITITAGDLEGSINLTTEYGAAPKSFTAEIIEPEKLMKDSSGDDWPTTIFPKKVVGNARIPVRMEYDSSTSTSVKRDTVNMNTPTSMFTKVYMELADSVDTDANYQMVHNVIFERPLTVPAILDVEYEVTLGSYSNKVNIVLECNPADGDSVNGDNLMWKFDFYELIKDYKIPLNLYRDLYVENGEVTISTIANITSDQCSQDFFVDGDDAFYKLTFNALLAKTVGKNELMITPHEFMRHSLYKKIINKSVRLYNGTDGSNLFNHLGYINCHGDSSEEHPNAKDLLLRELNRNEELRQVLYPKYTFDYLPTWCEDIDIINAGINLCDSTEMAFGLHSLPKTYDSNFITSGFANKDIDCRQSDIFKSTVNNMLYTSQGNNTHVDIFTGEQYYMPASYYALMNHLKIDKEISITEPVANIEKGVIRNQSKNLQYSPSSLEIESLRNAQINSIIIENDGTYIIDQLTMFKKLSKLNNANVVKTIQALRKKLPSKLKPFLQKKATADIQSAAVQAAYSVVNQYVISNDNLVNGIFEYAKITPYYNEVTKRLRLTMTISPIGTIEIIEVPIVVV